jgi:hypothetical protein
MNFEDISKTVLQWNMTASDLMRTRNRMTNINNFSRMISHGVFPKWANTVRIRSATYDRRE